MQVWLKFNHWFGRKCVEMADLHSLYGMVTLKIRSRSPKSDLQPMYLCKFGQNPSTGSEDNAQKPYFGHFNLENKIKVTQI